MEVCPETRFEQGNTKGVRAVFAFKSSLAFSVNLTSQLRQSLTSRIVASNALMFGMSRFVASSAHN